MGVIDSNSDLKGTQLGRDHSQNEIMHNNAPPAAIAISNQSVRVK